MSKFVKVDAKQNIYITPYLTEKAKGPGEMTLKFQYKNMSFSLYKSIYDFMTEEKMYSDKHGFIISKEPVPDTDISKIEQFFLMDNKSKEMLIIHKVNI